MALKSRLVQFVFAVIITACMTGSSLAEGSRPPAGQMCPEGAYVIGFDAEGNIICSEAGENRVQAITKTSDDGNIEADDNCPAACQAEELEASSPDQNHAAEAITTEPVTFLLDSDLVISSVKPPWIVFGTPEVTITVNGAGFGADSVIIFGGSRYSPSVNQAGTQLKVTIPIGKLSIGPYSIKVSNGAGMETTKRKALEIY